MAQGAAIQAGILQGDVKDVLLLDVTPLTLGIETLHGQATPLIDKNTTIPASNTRTFQTAENNQTTVQINVFQGERPIAADNKSLGTFILDGIPPMPQGQAHVEVTFDIDANGILNVTAKEKTTGKENSIKIEGSSGLSDDEINKMKADAEANAESDKQKKELIDAKNAAEQIVSMATKAIEDAGDKVGEDITKPINEKIEAVRAVKDGEDKAAIDTAVEELSKEVQKIGEAMQAEAGTEAAGQEGGPAQPEAQEAEVVDENEDEEKKD